MEDVLTAIPSVESLAGFKMCPMDFEKVISA